MKHSHSIITMTMGQLYRVLPVYQTFAHSITHDAIHGYFHQHHNSGPSLRNPGTVLNKLFNFVLFGLRPLHAVDCMVPEVKDQICTTIFWTNTHLNADGNTFLQEHAALLVKSRGTIKVRKKSACKKRLYQQKSWVAFKVCLMDRQFWWYFWMSCKCFGLFCKNI